MSPKVTVITPAYNVAPYLKEAMASVLAQSFADFEYIVVDDGSTDDTLAVARALAAEDPRVKVLTLPHGGLCATRNQGLRIAAGEFISFLDGDDVWSPEFLERQLREIELQGAFCAATFCRATYIDMDGAALEGGSTFPMQRWYLSDVLAWVCPPGNGSCLLLRAQPLLAAGFFDEKLAGGEDMEMWCRVLASRPEYFFKSFPLGLLKYRKRPGALTLSALYREESKKVLREVYGRYAARLSREQRFRACMAMATMFRGMRQDWEYRYWSARTFLTQPVMMFRSPGGIFSIGVLFLGTRAAFGILRLMRGYAKVAS